MHGVLPVVGERGPAREQALFLIDLQCRDPGRAGHRVRGIGIAVEQLDLAGWPDHQRIVDLAARKHRAQRNGTVGDALGGSDEIGRDAEIVGGKGRAKAAEPGNHLVEDQEDAVLVAQRT